jgi:hypothetical protein
VHDRRAEACATGHRESQITERTETTRTTTTTNDQDVVEEKTPGSVIINNGDVIVTEGQTVERPVNQRRTETETTTTKTERG